MRHQLLALGPDLLADALTDHRTLAERLAAHDAGGFAATLRAHLERHRGGL